MDQLELIRKSFKEYFAEPGVELPMEVVVGQTRSLEDVGSGWDITFKLYKQTDKLFLDFFCEHRRTNSRHERILESGEVVSLENYSEFGFSVYEDDPDREKREREEIYAKNQNVEDILRQKGLI